MVCDRRLFSCAILFSLQRPLLLADQQQDTAKSYSGLRNIAEVQMWLNTGSLKKPHTLKYSHSLWYLPKLLQKCLNCHIICDLPSLKLNGNQCPFSEGRWEQPNWYTQAKDLPAGMLVTITSAIIITTFKVPEVWRVVWKTKFCSISVSLVLPLRRVSKDLHLLHG